MAQIIFKARPHACYVKLFRWLDNRALRIVPPVLNCWCRDHVRMHRFDTRRVLRTVFAHRNARLEKEVSEAKQALMLDAPKKEKLKELGEGIFEMFRVDPDLTAPLLAMVTTMLGDVKTSEKAKAGLREQNRLSGAKTECNCGAKYVKHS
jgi:hypothetical protein